MLSFGASSALAKQIDAGAPADLFISADEQWMDYVAANKLIKPETRVSFLGNSLVLVSPAAKPLKIKIAPGFALAKALGDFKLAMADPDAVPAGKYGKAALTKLGVWADVEPKVVRGENVRAALAFVARGESGSGDRLCHRRQGRKGRHCHRHLPRGQPRADHLSDRRPRRIDQPRRRSLPQVPGLQTRQGDLRALRLRAALTGLTPAETAALALSLRVGLVSVTGALPVAFGLGWLLARGRFPGKAVLDAIIHLPLVLPPVVTGYALLIGFGRTGWLGGALHDWFGVTIIFRWTGAALASAIMALPLMVRAIRLSVEAIDRRLEVAARTLGATPIDTLVSVTLPLALPGIVAGVVLGFARSVGEFGATITFVSNIPGETQTLPIAIYSVLQQPGGEASALRLSGIAVALSLAALLASEWLTRRATRGRAHVL